MLYLHDVWVNWFEGEENGYGVCPYYEWRKEDQVELLDQVPLLYITSDLFTYIEDDLDTLPMDLLTTIYRKTSVRKARERCNIEYAAVVTDGNEILVFDTIGYQLPIKKSRIIPRQETLVFEMIKKVEQKSFAFKKTDQQKEYHILSMEPSFVVGLTRRERKLKQILMIALDQLKMANNLEELRYWLTEWEPKKYPRIRYMNEEEVWDALYNGVEKGWTVHHEELGLKLIRGQSYLERLWETEQEYGQNPSKL